MSSLSFTYVGVESSDNSLAQFYAFRESYDGPCIIRKIVTNHKLGVLKYSIYIGKSKRSILCLSHSLNEFQCVDYSPSQP